MGFVAPPPGVMRRLATDAPRLVKPPAYDALGLHLHDGRCVAEHCPVLLILAPEEGQGLLLFRAGVDEIGFHVDKDPFQKRPVVRVRVDLDGSGPVLRDVSPSLRPPALGVGVEVDPVERVADWDAMHPPAGG